MPTSSVWRGAQLKAATKRGSAKGLNLAAERLRGHSVEKAPVDLGDLRGSAAVIPATPAELTATLVFDEPYAAAQHERDDYQHTPGAAGEPAGQAHYVSSNFEDSTRAAEYSGLIGKAVRDEWG